MTKQSTKTVSSWIEKQCCGFHSKDSCGVLRENCCRDCPKLTPTNPLTETVSDCCLAPVETKQDGSGGWYVCAKCKKEGVRTHNPPTEPMGEKVRNPFCELWCNLCDKHIPAEEVKINYSTDGHIIFSHNTNHLLEVEIDTTQSVQEAKAEEREKTIKEILNFSVNLHSDFPKSDQYDRPGDQDLRIEGVNYGVRVIKKQLLDKFRDLLTSLRKERGEA